MGKREERRKSKEERYRQGWRERKKIMMIKTEVKKKKNKDRKGVGRKRKTREEAGEERIRNIGMNVREGKIRRRQTRKGGR